MGEMEIAYTHEPKALPIELVKEWLSEAHPVPTEAPMHPQSSRSLNQFQIAPFLLLLYTLPLPTQYPPANTHSRFTKLKFQSLIIILIHLPE